MVADTPLHREGALRFPPALALLSLLAAAWLLRLYQVDAQSLWADEGTSLQIALKPAAQIVQESAWDVHPPLYYLLLSLWIEAIGITEMGLRSLSALWGVLAVALTATLGRRFFQPRIAWLAAWLTALSPLLVHYSQEARMYQQMTALGLLSTYLALRLQSALLEKRRGWPLALEALGYLAASLALVYSHYFGLTVLAFHQVLALLTMARPRPPQEGRGGYLPWLLLTGAMALLYYPWWMRAFPALVMRASRSDAPPLSLWDVLPTVLKTVTLGRAFPEAPVLAAPLLWGLALLGAVAALWPGRGPPLRLMQRFGLLLWLTLPLAALSILHARSPLYFPEMAKLVLGVVPAIWLLVAAGCEAVQRGLASVLRGRAALLASLVPFGVLASTTALLLPSLVADLANPRYGRDNYRGLARYLEQVGRPGDAVLLDVAGQEFLLDYYYGGPLPLLGLPRGDPIDVPRTTAELETLLAQHQRLWVVLWAQHTPDPERRVERWLSQYAFKGKPQWFGNVQLIPYLSPLRSPGAALQSTPQALFGGAIELVSYRLETLSAQQLGSVALPRAEAGDPILLQLRWRALRPVPDPYITVLQLTDAEGHTLLHMDAEPANGAYPLPSWSVGEIVGDNYALTFPDGAPAGLYYVRVRLERTYGTGPLPQADRFGRPLEGELLLGPVITGAVLDREGAQEKPGVLVGPAARLLAGQVVPTRLFPGSSLSLTLVWQATDWMERRYTVFTHLLDAAGRLWAQHDGEPAQGTQPTTLWSPGTLVVDSHAIPVPEDLPLGSYTIAVGLYDRSTGDRLSVHSAAGDLLGDQVILDLSLANDTSSTDPGRE